MKQLVHDNFDDFVHCRYTIDQIYKLMQQEGPAESKERANGRRTQGVGKSRTSRVEKAFKGAELITKSSFEPLIEKRRRVQKLRRALELLSRSELVWKVPQQVRREIEANKIIEATLSFCSSSGHLSSLHDRGVQSTSLYKKAVEELEECGVDLVERLFAFFGEDAETCRSSSAKLSPLDALSLILELKAKVPKTSRVYARLISQHADPVCLFIYKQEGLCKERIRNCESQFDLVKATDSVLKLWEELIVELQLKMSSKTAHGVAEADLPPSEQTSTRKMLLHIRRRNSSSCSIQELANRRSRADHWVATMLQVFSCKAWELYEKAALIDTRKDLYREVIKLTRKAARVGAVAATERVVANTHKTAEGDVQEERFIENIQKLGLAVTRATFDALHVGDSTVELSLSLNSSELEGSIESSLSFLSKTFDIGSRSIPWDEGYPKLLFDTCCAQAIQKLEALCDSIVNVAKTADSARLLKLVALCGGWRSNVFTTLSRGLEEAFQFHCSFAEDNEDLVRQYSRLENALLAKYVQDKSRAFKPIIQGALREYSRSSQVSTKDLTAVKIRPYATCLLAKLVSTASECVQSVPAFDSRVLMSGLLKQLGDQLVVELKQLGRSLTSVEVCQLDLELGFMSQALGGFETKSARAAFKSAQHAVVAMETVSAGESAPLVRSPEWQSRKREIIQDHTRKVQLLLECFTTT